MSTWILQHFKLVFFPKISAHFHRAILKCNQVWRPITNIVIGSAVETLVPGCIVLPNSNQVHKHIGFWIPYFQWDKVYIITTLLSRVRLSDCCCVFLTDLMDTRTIWGVLLMNLWWKLWKIVPRIVTLRFKKLLWLSWNDCSRCCRWRWGQAGVAGAGPRSLSVAFTFTCKCVFSQEGRRLIQKLLPLKICIAHPSLLTHVSQHVLNVSFLFISCISISKDYLMVLANPAKREALRECSALLRRCLFRIWCCFPYSHISRARLTGSSSMTFSLCSAQLFRYDGALSLTSSDADQKLLERPSSVVDWENDLLFSFFLCP